MTTVPSDLELAEAAIDLARRLLRISLEDETSGETRRRNRLGRLLEDDDSMELVLALTDEVMRIEDDGLAANRFAALIDRYGTGAFGAIDSTLLKIARHVAPRLPRLVMPIVLKRTRAETEGVILSADDPALARHIAKRTEEDVRLNINALGEAILSDAEAEQRAATVFGQIARPDVTYVSVKLSSVVANLDIAAFDLSVERVADRLRALYRAAESATPRTFVSLDMEEFRDLELTLAAFTTVLDEEEFASIDAGIVLQAYLPDSRNAAEQLGSWALRRFETNGGTVKVRLVKGANLAMEQVEAELHGWVAAPYATKAEVDANFKAVLDSLLRPEWNDAVRVGLASHNLFDVSWAIVRSRALAAQHRVEFEMLEGMAPSQARAIQQEVGDLLMYSPVVADADYGSSLAYLSRRLDENTQPDNFLRSLFSLEADSPEFDRQADMFRAAVTLRHSVGSERLRRPAKREGEAFENEPELDFTDPAVRDAVANAVAKPAPLPPAEVSTDREIDAVMSRADGSWVREHTKDTLAEIRSWLDATATIMAAEQPDTVALLASETHKTVGQASPEISEAIDFCRYYGATAEQQFGDLLGRGFGVAGRGVVAVVAPWNFPYAIPTGGVASALAAGNAVILKPAPEAAALGARIVDQFHRGGVPVDRLQLVVCQDGPVGQHLVTHPQLDTVTLTGSYETAALFQSWKPDRRVLAETSGKNALVITAAADLDLAIADLVTSAFGHSGQKCSAASLGIITADVYDSPHFLPRLRDAVESYRVGAAADPATMMGPVIGPPTSQLRRALTTLDSGESWLVEPSQLDADGTLWSPGVRTDVAAGSWFHRNECFGPVLGLMRVTDLDEAIKVQNGTDFGLTGGIHSLDPAEVTTWLDRVEVGNAYVNRVITGAVVQRQPFGGWKKSSVGGSAKAGGPGYVQQFATITDPDDTAPETIRDAYRRALRQQFETEHDPSGLRAESNVLRYLPLERVVVRHDGSTNRELKRLRIASDVTGVELIESDARLESIEELDSRMGSSVGRLRLLTDEPGVLKLGIAQGVAIDRAQPSADGFVELYRWFREQSISTTQHRHGRISSRG